MSMSKDYINWSPDTKAQLKLAMLPKTQVQFEIDKKAKKADLGKVDLIKDALSFTANAIGGSSSGGY